MSIIKEKAYIFGTIFTLANKMQVLGDKLDSNVTVKQWLLLAAIIKSNREALPISEVADLIGNSRQNVKKMALKLEKEGFVALENDKTDARILKIMLTEKCSSYFQQRQKIELDFLNQLFSDVPEKEIHCLAQGIASLEYNIEKMASIYKREYQDGKVK